MAELNRKQPQPGDADSPILTPYAASGHPTLEQLMAEQGTQPVTDVSTLHGDFWPEDESIETFLAELHQWRGHRHPDPAA